MIFRSLSLPGAFLIDLEKREDDRGFFSRVFCETEFSSQGLETRWVQINNSYNRQKATLRGLHFQRPPRAEAKVVRCIKGAVWDVIVDLRKRSPTFSHWFGTELSESNRTMMYVPRGFAHGFVSLTECSELIYLTSEHYSPDHQGTLRWDDPFHKIRWPIEPLVISDKDRAAASITASDAIAP